MSDVLRVRSLVERLVTIAADCFDRRAAERLRELAEELHDSNRQDKADREVTANAGSPGA